MSRIQEACPLCGRLISKSNLSRHIQSHENGNFDKYAKKSYHLDHIDLICKFCKKEFKTKNSLVQHEIRCPKNINRINVLTTNFNYTERQAWNKGLTKDTDKRVNKYAETYKKNHQLGLHKDRSGVNNSSSRQDVKDKISKTCLEKSKDGTWHTSLAKRMHYEYKGNDLHGTWELAYAIYLDEHNIKWKRNKDKFQYVYQDKMHYYTPDFYLIDTNQYVEIKGYKNGKDYAKWKQFPEDKHLIVLQYEDLFSMGIFQIDIHEFKSQATKSMSIDETTNIKVVSDDNI